MKTKLLTSLITISVLGLGSANASITIAHYSLASGSTTASSVDSNVTASLLANDFTGDSNAGFSGSGGAWRVNGVDTDYNDDKEFWAFSVEAASGYVFDMTEDGLGDIASDPLNHAWAQVRGDRISGDFGIEVVIWEGTDRTGSELFRQAHSFTADELWRVGPITSIAAADNISQLYVQFNYRNEGGSSLAAKDFRLNGAVVAVPEPSTFALLAGFGALGFILLRRRLRD